MNTTILALTSSILSYLILIPRDAEPLPAKIESKSQESLENAADTDDSIRQHVVKVHSFKRNISLTTPWKRGDIVKSSGSGVWLGDGKILTNAHVVMYSSQLDIQPFDSSERISAEVTAISPGMDLAILSLEDASNFDGLDPLPLSIELPTLRSSVQAYGYPTGGSAISVTEGVISRIEYASYPYGSSGLRIQIDAGINPGNSGGPAVSNGQMVGIVTSRLRSGDNIGYLIPAEEIELFIKDVEDGTYDGKPYFRETVQELRNKSFRRFLNISDDETGVVIVDLFDDAEDYPLKKGDVLTRIGPHDIDNDGMVRLAGGIRLLFQYFVPALTRDATIPAEILRDGKSLEIQIPVGRPPELLIESLEGRYPEYFVYGPAVFVEVTSDFLDSYLQAIVSAESANQARLISFVRGLIKTGNPLVTRAADLSDGERLVVLASPLLPHKTSKGYSNFSTKIVDKINGSDITDIRQMVELLRDADTDFVKFEFVTNDNRREIVFDRKEVEAATEDILDEYSIPRQASKSLMKIWNRAD